MNILRVPLFSESLRNCNRRLSDRIHHHDDDHDPSRDLPAARTRRTGFQGADSLGLRVAESIWTRLGLWFQVLRPNRSPCDTSTTKRPGLETLHTPLAMERESTEAAGTCIKNRSMRGAMGVHVAPPLKLSFQTYESSGSPAQCSSRRRGTQAPSLRVTVLCQVSPHGTLAANAPTPPPPSLIPQVRKLGVKVTAQRWGNLGHGGASLTSYPGPGSVPGPKPRTPSPPSSHLPLDVGGSIVELRPASWVAQHNKKKKK